MWRRLRRRWADDAGVGTPVEMMYLLIFCLVSVFFLVFVGRLHAAGTEVTNTAQQAARAASLAPDPRSAKVAAQEVAAASVLGTRCAGGPTVVFTWASSPTGTWQGGSVTVTLRCTVRNETLSGFWAPGSRTISMSDTQPVDRYRR